MSSVQEHGLHLLYSPEEHNKKAKFDIVAIHGEGGHPLHSWTNDETGSVWIRDFLPGVFPHARVFTFGYKSEKLWTRNSAEMVSHGANNLLARLQNARDELPVTRPILFICHSLGGILLKRALLIANQMREQNQHLVDDTCRIGVVFMGSPHDNVPETGPSPGVFAKLSSSAKKNLEQLKEATQELKSLVSQFSGPVDRLTFVISMYSMDYPAVMNLGPSREIQLAVYTDISQMCKFASTLDSNYTLLIPKLVKMVGKWFPKDERVTATAAISPPTQEAAGPSPSSSRPHPSRSVQSLDSYYSPRGSRRGSPVGSFQPAFIDHAVADKTSPYPSMTTAGMHSARSLVDSQNSPRHQKSLQYHPSRSTNSLLEAQIGYTGISAHPGATAPIPYSGDSTGGQIQRTNIGQPMAPSMISRQDTPYPSPITNLIAHGASRISQWIEGIDPNLPPPDSLEAQNERTKEDINIQIQLQKAQEHYNEGHFTRAFTLYKSIDARLKKALGDLSNDPNYQASSEITQINKKRMVIYDRLARCCLERYEQYRDRAASASSTFGSTFSASSIASFPDFTSDSALSDCSSVYSFPSAPSIFSASPSRVPSGPADLPEMLKLVNQGYDLNRKSQYLLQLIPESSLETPSLEYWMLRTTELALGIAQVELAKNVAPGDTLDRAAYLIYMHEFGLVEEALRPVVSGQGDDSDSRAAMARDILRDVRVIKERKLRG